MAKQGVREEQWGDAEDGCVHVYQPRSPYQLGHADKETREMKNDLAPQLSLRLPVSEWSVCSGSHRERHGDYEFDNKPNCVSVMRKPAEQNGWGTSLLKAAQVKGKIDCSLRS